MKQNSSLPNNLTADFKIVIRGWTCDQSRDASQSFVASNSDGIAIYV